MTRRTFFRSQAPGASVGTTNLSIANTSSTTLQVASSTGTAATVPVATGSVGGLMSAADKTKLDAVALALTVTGKSADYTTTDSDFGVYLRFTAGTPTLHSPAAGFVGQSISIRNATGSTVTVGAGAATVAGSRQIAADKVLVVVCTGAGTFDAIGGS